MNPTKLSLLSQMNITGPEIARRKELLGFTLDHAELLAACRPFIVTEVDRLVDLFYEKQTAVDEISVIIGDADSLTRLKNAMTRYVTDLFSGYYDEEYVNNRLRIGLVHKRIGVSPKYYLSAMHLLKSLLLDVLSRHLGNQAAYPGTVIALDKLLYLDTEFVFDTYIRSMLTEIETAKEEAVQHALSLEEKVAARTRELEDLSRRDPLTGLHNRRHFMDALRRELARAERSGHPLCLAYLDVNDFKQINDRDGHLAGDAALRHVANQIQAACRDYDISCRYGGDEFCILLPDTQIDGAAQLAQRLQRNLQGVHPEISVSIGIVQAGPTDWPDAMRLVGAADKNMYEAKSRDEKASQPIATLFQGK